MRHRAFIYDRGGRTLVGELRGLERVRWSRRRDDISEADITAKAHMCEGIVSYRHVGRYELVITRDDKREWEGPITLLKHSGATLTIHAKDIGHYLNRTVLSREWDNSGKRSAYCVDRLEAILRYELNSREQLNPPLRIIPNLQVVAPVAGDARTTKKTLPYQKYVWQEMDDMAWRNGIDYTVTRRSLMIWDNHREVARTRPVSEADFDTEFALTAYGVELATEAYVTDGEGRAGRYGPGTDPYYGIVSLLATEYDEGARDNTSIAELQSQAQRNYNGRNPTPVSLRVPENSSLAACAVEELFPYLFAGVRLPVKISSPYMPELTQVHVLNTLNVEETPDGEVVQVSIGSAAQEEVMEE